MKQESQSLLAKADRAVKAAASLLKDGQPDFAAGRAYYAMFYAAEALLEERGLDFSKHSGVHAAFGQHFAKPGILDAKYHRWLLDAFDKRILGDYSYEMEVTKEDAEQMLVQSREFVAAARSFLEAQDRSD